MDVRVGQCPLRVIHVILAIPAWFTASTVVAVNGREWLQ
jgi:hypothetical protein